MHPSSSLAADVRYLLARRKAAATRLWRQVRPKSVAWTSVDFGDELRRIHEENIDTFDEHDLQGIGPERAEALFGRGADWRLRTDRIDELQGDILVEPIFGIAFLPGARIFEPSRNIHVDLEPRTDAPPAGATIKAVPELVHFDGFLGKNLWHFHCDCLGPLLMLRETGKVDPDLPVLIHRQVWDTPHVQHALASPKLEGVRWLIQEPSEWIACKRLYKADCGRDAFLRVRELFNREEQQPRRRIFLDRRPRFRRIMTNQAEVLPLLRDRGFEQVFAEDLSYEEQVRLFAQTRHLVALHGAGLVNMLHSDPERLGVIEILSEAYLKPHYYWLSRTLGVRHYDAVVGTGLNWQGNYSVDAVALAAAVDRLLASDTSE
jgi:hypothetical protein